jgi:predicted enzyme related to lactoylglutathione lyase
MPLRSLSRASAQLVRSLAIGLVITTAAPTWAHPASTGHAALPEFAVGAQYDTTHVYVQPAEVDAFVASFVATFGGASTGQGLAQVTPTPSSTSTQLIQTPAGTVSLFGFRTGTPWPFGAERTGWLVTDLDKATAAARAAGAEVVVAPFNDPIGRDVVIRWPGGVTMQLYWHTTAPNYARFETQPENRIYISTDAIQPFLTGFTRWAHAKVVEDKARAPGIEIGRAGETYRRISLVSKFGRHVLLVTDGHLPYPYGRETTGYAVRDLDAALTRATGSGAKVLVPAFAADHRRSALIEFPGGYIAEIHQPLD